MTTRATRTLAVAIILSIALPMLSEANPKALLAGATPGSARTSRMLSTQQSVPALVGTVGGVELNTIVRLLNVLNREVDVELLFMPSGEAEPVLSLQRRLARREMALIDVGQELSNASRRAPANGFRGAVVISSDRPVAAIVSLLGDSGAGGSFLGYSKKTGPSTLGPIFSDALTSILQFVNFEQTLVQLTSFLNDLLNQSVGNPLQVVLQPGGNETIEVGDAFSVEGAPNPLFTFNGVTPDNSSGNTGVVVIDDESLDVLVGSGAFPNGGQDFFFAAISESELSAIFRNNGANVADLEITPFNVVGDMVDGSGTTETLRPNETKVVDFGMPLDEADFKQPRSYRVEIGFRFRRSVEDSISAVLIADQVPAGRAASMNTRTDGITPGNYHTLVPSWTEDYAANKRAVAMGATASDTATVTFCAFNIGPKKARVKVVVRRADGSRVFSKSVDIDPNATVDVPLPKRVQGDDLYVDAKISKGSVFTYFLEKHATGEINYIPGIAVK